MSFDADGGIVTEAQLVLFCVPSSFRQFVTHSGFQGLNRFVIPIVKAGLVSPLPVGIGLVVLEPIGRRSGLPRQVPLVSVRVGDTIMMSTVRNRSQWEENADASGSARAWVGGVVRPGTASVRRGRLQVVVLDLGREAEHLTNVVC